MTDIGRASTLALTPPERLRTSVSCSGSVTTNSPCPLACHGGGSCPFDEPDNWETYEPDPVAEWDDPI